MAKKRRWKIWLYILVGIFFAVLLFIVYFNIVTRIDPPTEMLPGEMGYEREMTGPGSYRCEDSWLRLNDHGLWELYIEGSPLELGTLHGLLCGELVRAQEDAFVDQIKLMIPSESYLKFLKYFTAWFNRDLDEYIAQEYLLEIYGVSAFASDNYGFIGPKYDRILNYHAAHDIGHALQNLNLVKCTAFGVWNEKSSDRALMIGRNFDFYVGDTFAENKIIAFMNPDQGYKFASVTWGGMIGVVSGMNEKGLTVTLNSAKSDIPFRAKTPVSLIAREILQYASNIEEALSIASSRESFVSESFLVGSAFDHKAVVIEKSADTTVLYDPDTNFIILTNHFQSDYFRNSPLTIENMANETSVYRHERVEELLAEYEHLGYRDAASILRNRQGLGNQDIGMGNEKAINQLIAHHSIIFKPEEKKFWVSTSDWQLGPYICYDLDSVFSNMGNKDIEQLSIPGLEIMADQSMHPGTFQYDDFIRYRTILGGIHLAIKEELEIKDEKVVIRDFVTSNPEYFLVYVTLGHYYQMLGNKTEAIKYYNFALTKEISSADERKAIENNLQECQDE